MEGDAGQVILAGWVACRRDHGGVIFIDLWTASGTYVVFRDPQDTGGTGAGSLGWCAEFWCVSVAGVVEDLGPEGNANLRSPPARMRLNATSLTV